MAAEQNFNTMIFRFANAGDRRLGVVYKLEDLNCKLIERPGLSRGYDRRMMN